MVRPLGSSFVSGGPQVKEIPMQSNYTPTPIQGGQGGRPAVATTSYPAAAGGARPKAEQPKLADQDVVMAGDDSNGAAGVRPPRPWEKNRVPGAPVIKKRPNKKMIQQRLKKHLTPKNATVALSHVFPDAKYTFASMSGSANLFTAEVEVSGKKYHGVGGSKSLARAAASELALQSMVKKPVQKKNEKGEEVVEDETPWAALASFALHKLFCDWKRGVVGAPVSLTGGVDTAQAAGCAMDLDQPMFQSPPVAGISQAQQIKQDHAGQKKTKGEKKLPEDAATRHPVTLLHEMRDNISFDGQASANQQPGQQGYTMRLTVDGVVYEAKAQNKKQAKIYAAKTAVEQLFGVVYSDPLPAVFGQ